MFQMNCIYLKFTNCDFDERVFSLSRIPHLLISKNVSSHKGIILPYVMIEQSSYKNLQFSLFKSYPLGLKY